MAAIGAATPNVGKTHVKNTRLILDAWDLSGSSRQVGSWGVTFDTNDITGYSDGVHFFNLGHANHILSGYQSVFSNFAIQGTHTELKDRESYIASYCVGVRAAPEIGSTAWLSTMEQLSYNVQGGGGSELIDVEFGKSYIDDDHINPWGVVLEAATSRAGTVDLAGVDNFVPTTNGILAHLHVVATSGTTWTFDLEESSDDEAADNYVSIATFVADGSAVTAERIDVAGAVERYLRLAIALTGGAGTVSVWCMVARGLDLG